MVADEDDLSRSPYQRHKARGFGRLGRFIEKDTREAASIEQNMAGADAGAAEHLSTVENIVSHLPFDSTHLLPTAVEFSVSQTLLLALHPRDSAGEFVVQFEMLCEVAAQRVILHLRIDRCEAKVLADLDRLAEADGADAEAEQSFEQIVDGDIRVGDGEDGADVLARPSL